MSTAATLLSSSPERWPAVPTPAEPKLIEPGLARASLMSSSSDVAATDGCTTGAIWVVGEPGDRYEVAVRVVAQALVQILGGGQRFARDEERIAVGRGLRHLIGGDVAARPGPVVDHDRLRQGGGEPGHEQARQAVVHAARRK